MKHSLGEVGQIQGLNGRKSRGRFGTFISTGGLISDGERDVPSQEHLHLYQNEDG